MKPISLDDIEMYLLFEKSDNKYLLGSKKKDRYVIVSEDNGKKYMKLLSDLNGENDYEDLAIKWNVPVSYVYRMVHDFCEKGLLVNSANQNDNTEINRLCKKLISIPCGKLQKMNEKKTNSIIGFFLCLLIISLMFNICHILQGDLSDIRLISYRGSYILALIVSSIIMIPSFFFHELCHAIAAIKYGLKPKRIDICLYLFMFPLYYVKIGGIYTVSKRKRIVIMSAGLVGNIFLASIALSLYILTTEVIFAILVLSQINIFIANINPFTLSDGYFIASHLFKVENIRTKVFDIITSFNIKKYLKDKKVIVYLFINIIYVGINITYISRYAYSILKVDLNFQIDYNLIIFFEILMIIIYFIIVRSRYRKGMKISEQS